MEVASARSNTDPALGTSAGEKLTTSLAFGQVKPERFNATLTRCFASFVAPRVEPMMVASGTPAPTSAWTSTRVPVIPVSATAQVRPNPRAPPPSLGYAAAASTLRHCSGSDPFPATLVPHRLPAALLPDWLPGAQPVATGERVVDVRQGRRRAVDTAVTAATAVVAVRVGAQLTPHRCLTNTRPSSGNNTATTSIRTWSKREVLSLRNCPASRRNRCIFATVTASAGVPNRCDVRVLTSTTTNVAPSVATMSTSPAADRQFVARTLIPRDRKYLTAICSPRAPVRCFCVVITHPRPQDAGPCPPPRRTASGPVDDGPGVGGQSPGGRHRGNYRLGGLESAFGQFQVGFGQLFNVDVLESDHPNGLDEPGRAVHVPHPGIPEGQFEEHLTAGGVHLQVHIVRQVETPFCLDHIRAQPDDVAVLAVERQFGLGLVVLQVIGTHRSIMPCCT